MSDVVSPEGAAATPAAGPRHLAGPTEPAAAAAGAHAAPGADPSGMTIVAVTACPTGIAHTYMAAEALAAAGKKAGVNVQVEPQGSVGAETARPGRHRVSRAP